MLFHVTSRIDIVCPSCSNRILCLNYIVDSLIFALAACYSDVTRKTSYIGRGVQSHKRLHNV